MSVLNIGDVSHDLQILIWWSQYNLFMEQSNAYLMVRESSDQKNVVYRLGVNFQGEVTQWSTSPEEQIYIWNRHMYSPIYKDDNGERVIQIGFKNFTVDKSCSKYEVDVWMATSIGQVLEPQVVDDEPISVGQNIQRLTKLFQSGDISAEEFSLLIGQATGESERQSENDARKFKELEERADLAEYQGLWLAIFKNYMPLTLDQYALFSRITSLKKELDELPRNIVALTNLTAETFGLNFLAKGQIANEIARSIKKGKPLPDLTLQSISQLKAEMNANMNPLRQFARRQGWREVPYF